MGHLTKEQGKKLFPFNRGDEKTAFGCVDIMEKFEGLQRYVDQVFRAISVM